MSEQSTDDRDRAYILELMISEIRRADDWVNDGYKRVKTKTLTFLGGSFALLTFLYADGVTFIPKEVYGKIFYFAGLGLILGGMIALFVSLHPRRWEFSLESKDLPRLIKGSKLEYLEHVKDRYLFAYKANLKTHDKNAILLNRSFYPLILGATILVVLKIFGTEGLEQLCQNLMEQQ